MNQFIVVPANRFPFLQLTVSPARAHALAFASDPAINPASARSRPGAERTAVPAKGRQDLNDPAPRVPAFLRTSFAFPEGHEGLRAGTSQTRERHAMPSYEHVYLA